MNEMIELLLVYLIGVAVSFIGSMVGGGGLLSIPLLVFLGLPPQVAIATNRFGSVGVAVGATTTYVKKKKIIWKYVIPVAVVALIGGYIGANILLAISEALAERIIGIALILFLPFLFIRREIGVVNVAVSRMRKGIGYTLLFMVDLWGGFFTGGTGIFRRYVLTHFFGVTIIEAGAIGSIPWLLTSLLALIIFIVHDVVNYQYGIILFIGMVIGGYFGAHTAIRKGDAWVKLVFAAVTVASALKMLFF